jgi:hypothetical protein
MMRVDSIGISMTIRLLRVSTVEIPYSVVFSGSGIYDFDGG